MRCILACCLITLVGVSGIPYACQSGPSHSPRSSMTDRIDSTTNLAFALLIEGRLDTALQLSDWALAESERISYLFGQAESHSRRGSIFDEKEQYEKALKELLTCHELRKEFLLLEDSLCEERMVSSHNNLANTYTHMGRFPEAVAQIKEALHFVHEHKEEWSHELFVDNLRFLLHTKGNIFYDWGKPDSALTCYLKSLSERGPVDINPDYTEATEYQLAILCSQLGVQDTLLDKLLRENREEPNFLALLWDAKAQRLIDEGKNREARDTLYKSRDVREMLKDTIGLGLNWYNLGISYLNEGNYEEAKAHVDFALDHYQSQQQEERLAEAYTSLGILANAQGKTSEAFKACRKGYIYATQHENLEEAARASTQLVSLHEKVKQLDSAFYYQKQYRDYRKALQSHRESAIQIDGENKRIAEVQALEFSNLKERNRLTHIGAAVIITILLILLYFIIRQLIQNKKITEYKIQEQETAQKYIQYQRKGESLERDRMAKDIHDGLGQVLVAANNMAHEMGKEASGLKDEVVKQIQKMESWLDKARENLTFITRDMTAKAYNGFGIGGWALELKDRVEASTPIEVEVDLYKIDLPLIEDAELQLILIMTELVNNAQKYSEAKNLSIQLQRHESDLNMIIDDDGVGFSIEKALHTGKAGLGLGSIRKRVAETLGGKVIFDSVIGKGTSVIIDIPNIFLPEK